MIVIPMAGLSKRFTEVGFKTPKYMLEAHGESLFFWSVLSFKKYFKKQSFLFICLKNSKAKLFIKKNCLKLGILNFKIVELKNQTLGQAHTVYLGLKTLNIPNNESVLIFNIDTFRLGYKFPSFITNKKIVGYLECFVGSGKNWSNVITLSQNSKRVVKTSEKKNESNLCCTGIYFFSNIKIFYESYVSYYNKKKSMKLNEEHFIAPIYNDLIAKGNFINVDVINRSSVIFCGIPSEYDEFKKHPLFSKTNSFISYD